VFRRHLSSSTVALTKVASVGSTIFVTQFA
jgi:hypothetical protein